MVLDSCFHLALFMAPSLGHCQMGSAPRCLSMAPAWLPSRLPIWAALTQSSHLALFGLCGPCLQFCSIHSLLLSGLRSNGLSIPVCPKRTQNQSETMTSQIEDRRRVYVVQGARIGDTVVFSVGFNKKGEAFTAAVHEPFLCGLQIVGGACVRRAKAE